MGSGDRPEDEAFDEGGEPTTDASGEDPEGLSLFDDEPETEKADDEPEPEAEVEAEAEVAAEPEPGPPRAPETDEGSGGEPPEGPVEVSEPRRRRRGIYALGGLGVVIAVGVFLIGWTRVASSDTFCASCHEVEPAARSAARSVHADVSCLSCHTGPGLVGALRYVPTFVREVITEFTPVGWAHGVLEPRSCESCHDNLATTPESAAAHATEAKCASCHGDVSHPPFRLAGFARPIEPAEGSVHPRLYVQTHGDDVVRDPNACTKCHEDNYCETCHFRETYPHPEGWIEDHGPVQIERGPDVCSGCHPVTFCAGCHGTEIPHDARWMGEHWRDLQDASTAPCMVCHPKTDCTQCHARHEVHNEQSLYA